MNLQTKALYNLLRLNYAHDPSIRCEKWQIEDLREVPIEALFERLDQFKVHLDKDSFCLYAEKANSPEELADLLLEDHPDPSQHDPVYLLLFELWRRLLFEKQCLSIFCDELDRRISLYDAEAIKSDEMIQDALSNLADILDENLDAGAEPAEIFDCICSYCAHDLMSFVIDYITDVLDSGNQLYASELIEDFAPFASPTIWFDFLRARLTALSDPEEGNRLISQILTRDEELSVDLLLEILRFQTGFGERPVFVSTVKKILPRLHAEDEFRDLLELTADYFHRRDREDLEQAVQRLLSNRKNASGAIDAADPDIRAFEKLIPSH